jgi:hypothetical protein
VSTDGAPAVSDQLELWLSRGDETSLGDLIRLFGRKSFAIVFVLLLGVPAFRRSRCRPAARRMSLS